MTAALPDPARAACAERCAEFGDPPCYELDGKWSPCGDCLEDVGAEVLEPLDPNAVVAPLL